MARERVAVPFTVDQLVSAVWMIVSVEGLISVHALRFALVIDSDTPAHRNLDEALKILTTAGVLALDEGEYLFRWSEPEADFSLV